MSERGYGDGGAYEAAAGCAAAAYMYGCGCAAYWVMCDICGVEVGWDGALLTGVEGGAIAG